MEKKLTELHKLYSDIEKDIAMLKGELIQVKYRKNKLQGEAMCHVAKIAPDYFKKIFGGDSKNMLDPEKRWLEDVFVDQNDLCKNILGYTMSVGECSYEEGDKSLIKRTEVEGKMGENSFLVQFETEIALHQVSFEEDGQMEDISLRSVEIFPPSEDFEALATKLMDLDQGVGLRALIPCLYTYQTLQKERDMVLEKLALNDSIVISREAGSRFISITVDSVEFKIDWKISYRDRGHTYFDDFTFNTETEVDEVINIFDDHPALPYLKGDEPLMDGSDVLKLVKDLFPDF